MEKGQDGDCVVTFKKPQTREDWQRIKGLYRAAFPKEERKLWWFLRYQYWKQTADIWLLSEKNEFIGLAITVNSADMVLLDYFAIAEEKRCLGYGGGVLQQLQQLYREKRFFLEIEKVPEGAAEITEQERRKNFYLLHGMTELGIDVRLFGVDMELLGYQCQVSFEEYQRMYVQLYGGLAKRCVLLQTVAQRMK